MSTFARGWCVRGHAIMFCCAMPNKSQQSSWVSNPMVCAATAVHAVAHTAARATAVHAATAVPPQLALIYQLRSV